MHAVVTGAALGECESGAPVRQCCRCGSSICNGTESEKDWRHANKKHNRRDA